MSDIDPIKIEGIQPESSKAGLARETQAHRLGMNWPSPAPGQRSTPPVWPVVLAGGEGLRMRPWIKRAHGRYIPKQYCDFGSGSALIEETCARANRLAPAGHIVTVIGRGHCRYLENLPRGSRPGRVLEQPGDRGDGASVFLALSMIMAEAPEAVVVLMPSDQRIEPVAAAHASLLHAIELAARAPGQITLLGRPTLPEERLDRWIQPADRWSPLEPVAVHGLRMVRGRRRHATPPSDILWDTGALTARAASLWELGWRIIPDIMPRFDALRRYFEDRAGVPHASVFIPPAVRWAYDGMPKFELRRDLLRLDGLQRWALPVTGVHWLDLDEPDHALRAAASPAFSAPERVSAAH